MEFSHYRAWGLRCAGMLLYALAAVEVSATEEGSLDLSFGDHGRVFLGWSVDSGVVKNDAAIAVLGASDGGVILVGNATDEGFVYIGRNAIGVAKLNSTGQFDATFGDAATPGQTRLHGGGSSTLAYQIRANGAALQRDGKIVIVGNAYNAALNRQFAVVWRLNADGSLDTTFNGTGKVYLDRGLQDEFDSGNAVTIMQGIDPASGYSIDEGRIVVAGMNQFSPQIVVGEGWLVALNPDGSLVPTNAYGESIIDPGTLCDPTAAYHDYELQAITFQYSAEHDAITLYAAGNCIPRPSTGRLLYPFLVKVDNTLQPTDLNWGNSAQGGYAEIYDAGGVNVAYPNSAVTSIDASPNGEVVFAGYYVGPDASVSALYGAVKPNGGLDGTWVNGGVTIYAQSSYFPARGILFDPSGGNYLDAIIAGQKPLETCPPPPTVCGGLGTPWWTAKLDHGAIQSAPPFCLSGAVIELRLGDVCYYESNATGISGGGFYSMAYTPGRKILLGGFVSFSDGTTDFQVMRLLGDEIAFDGFGYASGNFH